MDGKFVLLAMQRTGSYPLTSILSSHPGICCHGELLRRTYTNFSEELQGVGSAGLSQSDLSGRLDDPGHFVDKVFALSGAGCKVGFKLMLGQSPGFMEEIVSDPSWKKILLFRENLLASYSSELIANVTGIGRANMTSTSRKATVDFCPQSFNVYRERREKLYNDVRIALSLSGREYYEIEYLDILEKSYQKELFEFLNVLPPNAITIGDVKRNSSDIASRFTNKLYVTRYLEIIGRARWAFESRESRSTERHSQMVSGATRPSLRPKAGASRWARARNLRQPKSLYHRRKKFESDVKMSPAQLFKAHLVAYDEGSYERALDLIDQSIEPGVEDAAVSAYRLRIIVKLGRVKEVDSALGHFLHDRARANVALKIVVWELVWSNHIKIAKRHLLTIAKRYPNVAEVHFLLGQCAEQVIFGAWRSLRPYETAMNLRPDIIAYLRSYAGSCMKTKQRGISKKLLTFREHYPGRGSYNMLMVRIYLYERDIHGARHELKIAAQDPRTADNVPELSKRLQNLEDQLGVA